MSMNSLVADSIARIKNAQSARHDFVIVKASKMVKSFISVLKSEGYIDGFEEFEQKPGIAFIKIDLKYYKNEPAIKSMKMLSKPGCRVYKSVMDLPRASNGLGTIIVSTSKGVMSDHQAIEERAGGELICEVF
ncbi:MAG: rpsH [Candidatus Midichloriaceae bacterium]|nr:rpsH [Candidatus Midichloriaceae bacterium]